MTIFVIGINHKTAPIQLREKIYFALDKLGLYLQDLLNRQLVREAVLLSTCNRSELYCEAEALQSVYDWFCAQTTIQPHELASFIYVYTQETAVAHMMDVACGLDSMVLGEPQILGQMKAAFSESCAAGAVDALFHRLFQHVFSVAKDIRTATAIGACPVSVVSAAVHMIKQRVPSFETKPILIIGAGEMAALLLRYLNALIRRPMTPITIVCRNVDKAKHLLGEEHVQYDGWDALDSALSKAEIIFSATGSAMPIIHKERMMAVNKPMVMIDMAVPRDIDPAVATLSQITLYCIDDLKNVIEHHKQGREHAADKAREMIQQKSHAFIQDLQSLDKVTHTIRAYRGHIESICHAELLKAKQQLLQGMDPAKVLEGFAHTYTNKLLHVPSVQLRQAGAEGRFELLKLAKQLFAIPDPDMKHS